MDTLVRECIRPNRWMIAVIGAVTLAEVIIQMIIINSVKPMITAGVRTTDVENLILIGLTMFILVTMYSAAAILVSRLSASTSKKVSDELRISLYSKILSLRNTKDAGANTSTLMTNLMSDVSNVQVFMTEFFRVGLYIPMLAVAIAINAFVIEPTLAASLVTTFLMTLAIVLFVSRHGRKERMKIQRHIDETVNSLNDLTSGIRTVRAFNRWNKDHQKFTENSKAWSSYATEVMTRTNYFTSMFTLITGLVLIVFMVFYMNGVDEIKITIENALIFVQLVVLFSTCAGIAPFFTTIMPTVAASYERVSKVLNAEPENHPDTEDIDSCDKNIISYPEINLNIPRGKETTLIGKLSSGKSTIAKTFVCLTDLKPGMVTFNGRDLYSLDPSYVRSRIAYAGDDALTFNGTLRENIDVWRGNSDETLKEVCEASFIDFSQLNDDIDSDSPILSINDRRKISIARALISDADVYIFDDCFNGFDIKTQIQLVDNIRSVLKGKTVIFVVQNALCSKNSDNIAFIERRTVIASGPHEEMIEKCQMYSEMVRYGGVA